MEWQLISQVDRTRLEQQVGQYAAGYALLSGMFWDDFCYAEACHQEKRGSTDCEYCQGTSSQWHFICRNVEILHELRFLQEYLGAAVFYQAVHHDG